MKTYTLIIVTLLLFVACSGSDEGLPYSVPVEITVSAGFELATAIESRSSVSAESVRAGHPLPMSIVRLDQSGESGESDPSYLLYPAGEDQGQEGVLRAGMLSGFDTGLRLSFDTDEYYLERASNNNTKLMAWYPALASAHTPGSTWAVDTEGVATVSFDVDGETDILLSDQVAGSQQQPFTDAAQKLTFAHLLTRFYVRVYTRDELAIANWGNLNTVTLRGKLQTCIATLPGEQETTSTKATAINFTGNGNLALAGITEELPIPLITGEEEEGFLVGTTPAGYAMVAPDNNNITIGVMCRNAGGKVTITAPSGGFAAGHSYTLALEFTSDGIKAGATLVDWDNDEDEGTYDLDKRPIPKPLVFENGIMLNWGEDVNEGNFELKPDNPTPKPPKLEDGTVTDWDDDKGEGNFELKPDNPAPNPPKLEDGTITDWDDDKDEGNFELKPDNPTPKPPKLGNGTITDWGDDKDEGKVTLNK